MSGGDVNQRCGGGDLRRRPDSVWPSLALIVCAAVARGRRHSAAQQPAPAPDYARDVVPILEANCVRCHSPAQQEGGLLLDTYEDLVKGGDSGEAFTPGNAASSRLVAMIEGRAKKKMPPKSDLRPDEIATLRAWIDGGAPLLGDPDPIARRQGARDSRSRAACCRR